MARWWAEVSGRRGLVLDANILIRAVFGKRVVELLQNFEDKCNFYTPDICVQDARKYVIKICEHRGVDAEFHLSVLAAVNGIVQQVDNSLYREYEEAARERVLARDPADWPIVAVALLLKLPIWTEDQDFFGSGIATWTTDRVEIYLKQQP